MPYKDLDQRRGAVAKTLSKRRYEMFLYKANTPCADCGFYMHPVQMDFDHRGDKLFEIGDNSGSWGTPRMIAEIAKCDVVCSNCHRLRTYNATVAELVKAPV